MDFCLDPKHMGKTAFFDPKMTLFYRFSSPHRGTEIFEENRVPRWGVGNRKKSAIFGSKNAVFPMCLGVRQKSMKIDHFRPSRAIAKSDSPIERHHEYRDRLRRSSYE